MGNCKDYQNLVDYLDHKDCQKLKKYIEGIRNTKSPQQRVVSEDLLDNAEIVWGKLRLLCNSKGRLLRVPSVCLGESDSFMFSWLMDGLYLECNTFSTGEVEFFYRDKNSYKIWKDGFTVDDGFEMILDTLLTVCY